MTQQQGTDRKLKFGIGHILAYILSLPFRLLRWMFRTLFLLLGGIIVISFLLGFFGGYEWIEKPVHLPEKMVLVFNIEDKIGDFPVEPSFSAPFSYQGLTVSELISGIDHAAQDPRVNGLLVSFDRGGFDLSHVQELRAAVKRLRAAGKFARIYTPSFAELGSGIGAYYFATAFDDIWMQPVGLLDISGVSMEVPFAKPLLEKIGVHADFLHREEYKSAMESFTNEEMSPANKEMMSSIVSSLSTKVFSEIASDRKMSLNDFQRLVDHGFLTGEEALATRLIDRVDYADVLLDEVQRKHAEGTQKNTLPPSSNSPNPSKGSFQADSSQEIPLVAIEDYMRSFSTPSLPMAEKDTQEVSAKKRVAFVRIVGEIVSGMDPVSGQANADYLAQAIKNATDDETISAIVLRVDSPGGSPTASETIRRAVVNAKKSGKPIFVSMAGLAASGGYWVCVDADRIFALPSTITGSIGVIMGKFEASALWEKIGVRWTSIESGQNAGMWSVTAPFTPNQRARMETIIESTYQAFIQRVAAGRKMTPTQVRLIAKGRAWTGLQAIDIGLVDEIGGLDVVLDHTAKVLGATSRKDIDLVPMPEDKAPWQMILDFFEGQVSLGMFTGQGAGVLTVLKELMVSLGFEDGTARSLVQARLSGFETPPR